MSIDEMMVPYKGKKASSRRLYIKNKPKKWCFKLFVCCGISGMVYDFIPYCGDNTFRDISFNEQEQSLRMSEQIVIAISN